MSARVLGFITARGGSKGIPRKNLADLAGRPLIRYTVDAALESRTLDRVFLSTEDAEIVEVCRALGLHSPYVRPASLAADDSRVIDCVLHGLDWLEAEQGYVPDAVALLQPTCPLRLAADIDAAVAAFLKSGSRSLVTVHELAEHPFECLRTSGRTWGFLARPEKPVHRRQDYGTERFYFINGAVYVNSTEFLRSQGLFVREAETELLVMPRERGLDVDTPLDLA
ncbi:MAG: acylneuraminate cytidylyltransferase family protein, partial [Desulfovibrionaceae bacterium]|nr:acylneuraminate cytidylyltransferase family protein [Desulfovibrionaceae bacterium]